jgi:predicted MPP superfamily phosphohydrolase
MTAAAAVLRYLPALVFWLGLHVWTGRQLLAPLTWPRRWRVVAWFVVVTIGVYPMVAMTLSRTSPGHPAEFGLMFSGMLVFGFASVVIALRVGVASITIIGKLIRAIERRLNRGGEISHPDLERRRFFGKAINAGVLSSAAGVTSVGVYAATQLPKVHVVEVAISNLDPALEGMVIAQLSDIHVGPTIRRPYVQGLVDSVNRLNADFVAITGDLVDGFVSKLSPEIAPLADLESRLGTFVVTGNHEYYWRGQEWVDHFEQLGMTVLGNEHRVLSRGGGKFTLAGVHDLHAARHIAAHVSDPNRAADGAPEGLRILLAHQPRSAAEAGETDAYDLQLSGHTHGGQYAPFQLMVWLAQPYLAGLHQVSERMQLYVSRGSGYWGPPIRAGAASEITKIVLTRAATA